jgi:hypothetical protein
LNDREIDELLNGAKVPPDPAAETLGRIAASIAGSMRPVRPMPSPWLLAGGVALMCAAIALIGAAATGFLGIAKMSMLERAAVFSTLAILTLVAAREFVNTMIPGSLRRLSSSGLLIVAGLCLEAVFALCFREYRTTHFFHAGMVCLAIGVLHAVPTGLLSWLALRRGFAVDGVSAGLAAGTVAGLAGVAMLELHCPNFETAHLVVWHVGVLLVSAGLGALCGWWRSSSTSANRETAGAKDATRHGR